MKLIEIVQLLRDEKAEGKKHRHVFGRKGCLYLRVQKGNEDKLMMGTKELGVSVERNADGYWQTEVMVSHLNLVHTMIFKPKEGHTMTALKALKIMIKRVETEGIEIEGEAGDKIRQAVMNDLTDQMNATKMGMHTLH